MFLKCIIALFIVLYSGFSFSQNKYLIDNFTADSGELPQNSVKSIIKDKFGFLWITTENGLVRFDGKNFKIFDFSSESDEIRLTSFEGSVEDDNLYTFIYDNLEKKIVVKDRNASVLHKTIDSVEFNKLKVNHYENYVRLNKLTDVENSNVHFHYTLKKNVYYVLYNQQLRYYNNGKYINFPKFPFTLNPIGFFILSNKLYYLDKENDKFYYFNNNGTSSSIGTSSNFEFDKVYFRVNLPAQQVFVIHENSIFMLSEIGNTLQFKKVFEHENLKSLRITNMFYDYENRILYLGSLVNGLYQVREKFLKTNFSFEGEFFYGIASLGNDKIINTKGHIYDFSGLLDKVNYKFNEFEMKIVESHENRIWIKQKNKLLEFEMNKQITLKDSLEFDKNIESIFYSNENKLWFSIDKDEKQDYIFGYFDYATTNKTKYTFKFKHYIRSIAQFNENTLFLGTSEGLYKYDIKRRVANKISNTIDVRTVLITADQSVWVMTYGSGLFLVRNNTISKIPYDEKGYLKNPHCVVEDKKGFIWIPTNNGLFQLKKQSIYDVVDKKKTKIYYQHYTRSDGLLTNEFNGGCTRCGVNLNDEFIVFPSMKGAVFVDTKRIRPIFANKETYIDKVEVDGETKSVKDTINLGRDFSFLKIFVDNVNYGNNENLLIEYRIKNFENSNWQKLSDDKIISFTTLPIGYLELEIRKLSDFSETISSKVVTIYVKPAFWQTTFFKFLAALFSILILYIFFRIRIYLIKRENRLLNLKINESTQNLQETIHDLRLTKNNLDIQVKNQKRMIGSITHDIKSPLKFMIFTSKILYERSSTNQDETTETLKAIYNSSFKLYHFVENLLEYSKVYLRREEDKKETFSIYKLFDEKIQLFTSLAKDNKTKIINKSNKNHFFHSKRVFISIIIHNLLDNSVKHTIRGKIVLEFEDNQQTQIIRVIDNGNGMDDEKRLYYQNLDLNNDELKFNTNSLGIRIIKELVIFLDAELIIESKPKTGTTVTVIFKSNV